MRILFYAVNGLGLGHVTRLLAIARQVRVLSRGAEILFLTSSEADSVIYEEGFPAVKVPSRDIARESGLGANIHVRLLQETAWSVFSSFNPDITVVDTFPLGFAYELDPVFKWDTSKFVFIYRQRREEKTQGKRFQNALLKYDLVILPHEKDDFGVTLPGPVTSLFAGNIIIRDREDLLPARQVCESLQLPEGKKYALITLGGGGQDGLERVILDILGVVRRHGHIHPVIAQGKLLRPGGLPAVQDCTVIKHYFPLCELYRAFDYVIAGCGYNTVNELLYFNKPALFLPFERQVDDQQRRAQEIAADGLGLTANPYDLSDVAQQFSRLLDDSIYTGLLKNLKKKRSRNNARRAARAIIRLARKKWRRRT